MKSESWKAFNPDAIKKSKLADRLRISYRITNNAIRRIKEIRPDIVEEFIEAFQSRISFVAETKENVDFERILELVQDYENLKDNHKLAILVTEYMFYHLKLPMKFDDLEAQIEVTSFNDALENERIRYYLARAGSDVVGEEEGIELWKKVVSLRLRDDNAEIEKKIEEFLNSGKKPRSMIERSDSDIKQWTDIGLGNFTRLIMDDHKILYRFDKCMTYEVLKDLNDPEYAYISSCYIGDAPSFNFPKRPQFLRRTQTLHHGRFCDELYWDPQVHEEPEQPSLEFTESM